MPHFALHLLLARTLMVGGAPTLEANLTSSGERNAFLHGAIGPDMGYFPGGQALMSDAAHLVRSGDLARTLLATAASPTQRAFAAGWLTHMLADILIHPAINETADRVLEREASPATLLWRRQAHIRVELGLDALYVSRGSASLREPLRTFLDARDASWMAAALREVYGVSFDPRAILSAHLQVVRLQRPLLLLERLIAAGRGARHPIRRALRLAFSASHRLAAWRLGPHSSAAGFLTTTPPTNRLVRTVDAVVDRFPEEYSKFAAHVRTADVNYCLDTGDLDHPGRPTPEAIAVTRRLHDLNRDHNVRQAIA
jgi:hypothetical protein